MNWVKDCVYRMCVKSIIRNDNMDNKIKGTINETSVCEVSDQFGQHSEDRCSFFLNCSVNSVTSAESCESNKAKKKGLIKRTEILFTSHTRKGRKMSDLSLLKVSSLCVRRFPEQSWAGKSEELYRKKHGEDTWPSCTSGFLPVGRLRLRWTQLLSFKSVCFLPRADDWTQTEVN